MKTKLSEVFGKLLDLIDPGSLKLRLWGYFGLFAVILVIMLWILQVVFLNYYYEDMKLRETQQIVAEVENLFKKEASLTEVRSYATNTYRESGIYMQIEPENGSPVVIPFVNFDGTPSTDASGNPIEELPAERPGYYYPTVYRNEIDNLKSQLLESGETSLTKQTIEPETERKTLEYAVFLNTASTNTTPDEAGEITVPNVLPDAPKESSPVIPIPDTTGADDATTQEAGASDTGASDAGIETDSQQTGSSASETDEAIISDGGSASPEEGEEEQTAETTAAADPGRMILYLFSPLYPQESTSKILTDQLAYVTIIAILLSILLGFYLSRMITRPIEEIAKRAENLASGNYGIEFPSSNYSEIERLGNTLSAASAELAETRTMQRDMIANVSHDLRTPLTMIRSYAEMIEDLSGNDPEKRSEHLHIIMDETDRLSAMIAELLDISKLHSGELSITRTDFSMKELIESTMKAYQTFVEQEGFKLVFASIGEGIVYADETRIKQTLDNLISNALKYGGKDKTVEIRMIEKDDVVRVEVTDHGIGISKRELKHIWERYYQTSAHHSRTDSTGLGLSIVKEILVLHNAKFGVDSAIRQGSTFWFELRMSKEPNEAEENES